MLVCVLVVVLPALSVSGWFDLVGRTHARTRACMHACTSAFPPPSLRTQKAHKPRVQQMRAVTRLNSVSSHYHLCCLLRTHTRARARAHIQAKKRAEAREKRAEIVAGIRKVIAERRLQTMGAEERARHEAEMEQRAAEEKRRRIMDEKKRKLAAHARTKCVG